MEGASQTVHVLRTEHKTRVRAEVDQVDVDAGVADPAKVAAHLPGLIDDRDNLDFSFVAALDARIREGLTHQLSALHQDVRTGLRLGETCQALDVYSGVAPPQ